MSAVVTAWAERNADTGFPLVKILVRKPDHSLQVDTISPTEQTLNMWVPTRFSLLATSTLVEAFKLSDPVMWKPGMVTAWAERCSGPGWSNALVWVLIREAGRYRVDAIQPAEQTAGMLEAFPYSALATENLTREVRRVYDPR